MILLDDNFMKNELDYETQANNKVRYYKDMWYFITTYICRPKTNRLGLTNEDIEQYILDGTCKKYNCPVKDKEERVYLFKRAMGLQVIYNETNGRNSMASGTSESEDVCRETYTTLKSLGLIQPVGW